MATDKHTDGAMRAAKHINKRQAVVFDRITWDVNELAGLIDRETGLPELKARIDRLEAERADLFYALEKLHGEQNGPPLIQYADQWQAAFDEATILLAKIKL